MKTFRYLTFLLIIGAATLEAAAAAPLKVHFISGSKEYKSEPSLKEFAEFLEKKGITCTASWAKDGGAELPNLEAIPAVDVLVVFARRMKLPEEQMKVVRAH